MLASARTRVTTAFLVFIALGLSQGVVGVAWPSMRTEFDRPLADLGTLLAVSIAGYFVAGLLAGRLTRVLGFGDVLTLTMTIGTVSLVGYAVADSWVPLLLASIGVGFTGGLIDSVVNAYVALHHSVRTMNLLHASFGIGATAGPLLVASSLTRGLSWRAAFVLLAIAEVLLLIIVFTLRRRWPEAAGVADGPGNGELGFRVLLLLAVFFCYVGLEVAAGQWSYSLLTESRGFGEFAAGVWVAAYWGGLTGGRLLLGVVGDRIGPQHILHLSMGGTLAATLVFWADPAGLGVLGLPLLGTSLAGIFPTLVSLTPSWVGSARSATVIGYQIAASSMGAAALPWVIGKWMDSSGLERLGVALFVAALAMTALHLVVERSGRDQTGLTPPTRTAPS